MQIPSGNSFGSDKNFAMDWTSADVAEVSSQRPASVHPSSGNMVAKNLHDLQIATFEGQPNSYGKQNQTFVT